MTTTLIGKKYEIVREIKRGGFGVIYQGMDQLFNKPVAIKTVDPALLGEAKYIDMFQREAVSIAQLNHQNIVQIFDIKRDEDGQIYIIMEYIDGLDLGKLLRLCRQLNRPLPLTLGVYIIAEICAGLDYAHNRRDSQTNQPLNIVHLDISPSNIMLSRSGEVKIIDFGMANLKRLQPRNKNEVYIQGKLNYLAPEQVNGSEHLDRRVDIFATGLILYEVITGERLIKSSNPQEVVELLRSRQQDWTEALPPDIPEKLQNVLEKSLAAKPENRYPTANQMYLDLMNYLLLTDPAADFMNDLANFVSNIMKLSESEATDQENLLSMPEVNNFEKESENENHHDDLAEATQAFEATSVLAEEGNEKEKEEKAPEALIEDHEFNELDEPRLPHEKEAQSVPSEAIIVEDAIQENEPEELEKETAVEMVSSAPTTIKQEEDSHYYSIVGQEEELIEDDEDQKTIIDVVRLSARTHKKAIATTLVSLIIGIIAFTVIDTFAHFTRMGTNIYDFLFPPAIKIESIPPGAQVFLDDQPLEATTPLSLDEISPGVHKLMLVLPRFDPIIKTINVPRKGQLKMSGEKQRHASQPFVLKFKSKLTFESQPSGAEIHINGMSINQKTPSSIYWEVSEQPVEIAMIYPGLPQLTGLKIDLLNGKEIIRDRRLWKFDKSDEIKDNFKIKGIFHKNITISSTPSRADIYLDNFPKPVGVTGLSGSLLLTVGKHTLKLKKSGYITKKFTININKNTPPKIHHLLLRHVRLIARDATVENGDDIGAQLVELSYANKTFKKNNTTPVRLRLLPYRYKAVLQKTGYYKTVVEISPTDKVVVAQMKPMDSKLTVVVYDASTKKPVEQARISYKDEYNAITKEQFFGFTDKKGIYEGKLTPGFYLIAVYKKGYIKHARNVRIKSNENSKLSIQLKPVQ